MRNWQTGVVHKLLEYPNINVNATADNGQTALIYAVSYSNIKAVRVLLACASTDVNIQDKTSETALTSAVSNNKQQITALLLSRRDTDISIRCKDNKSACEIAMAYWPLKLLAKIEKEEYAQVSEGVCLRDHSNKNRSPGVPEVIFQLIYTYLCIQWHYLNL